MLFGSVEKSVAVSEDGMRGQPLGDSAVARLDFANIWLSTAEWNDRVLAWMRNGVLPHKTSTFPLSM